MTSGMQPKTATVVAVCQSLRKHRELESLNHGVTKMHVSLAAQSIGSQRKFLL